MINARRTELEFDKIQKMMAILEKYNNEEDMELFFGAGIELKQLLEELCDYKSRSLAAYMVGK